MQCLERIELERKYRDARAAFEAVVQNYRKWIGICRYEEYLRLSRRLERAWHAFEQSRQDVDQHTQDHCCLSQGSKLPA